MFDNPCPRCHAEDEVVGNQTDEGIRLTCEQCGHSWLRAGPRCRTCGGEESLGARQLSSHERV